jgi:hypothetical protein
MMVKVRFHEAGGILLLSTLLLLGSCADTSATKVVRVNSQNEAAAVLVSPISVMPWSQVADVMQPNFALTGDQAALQVLPTTQRINEQVLSAFAASLGIGLPQTSSTASSAQSLTTTTTSSTAKPMPMSSTSETNTSTTGESEKPGVVPSVPSGTPAGATLPAGQSVSGDLGIDPILRYQTGLALFETVQMLNREVQNAAVLSNSVPFVAKLKIAVMPYRPHLPYSLHLRISFFSNRRCGSGPTPLFQLESTDQLSEPAGQGDAQSIGADSDSCTLDSPFERQPQVIPILVADDIERALKSRAVEVAQQIGFALSGMVNGIGASAGVNNLKQSLSAIAGQDLNSRLTIGRQTDNTLYARIGATNEATAGAALVGQTYDVAVLILVPRDYFPVSGKGKKYDPQIRVVTHVQFRDSLNGEVLPDRPAAILVQQVDAVMKQVLVGPGNPQRTAWDNLSDDNKERVARAFASPVQRSRFDEYTKLFRAPSIGGSGFSLQPQAGEDDFWTRQNIWTAITTYLADSAMKSSFFQLHWPQAIRIPQQTALIQDDGKEKAVIQLWGVGGQSVGMLSAKLDITPKIAPPPTHPKPKPKGGKRVAPQPPPPPATAKQVSTFAAQTVVIDSIAHTMTLTFPSPTKWGIADIDPGESKNMLTVAPLPCSNETLCPDLVDERGAVAAGPRTFPVLLGKAAADAKPNVAVTSAVSQVVAVHGAGSIIVNIDSLKDDSVTLTLSGADVLSVADSAGKTLPMTSKGLSLKSAGAVIFKLTNMHVGSTVTVTAEGKKGTASTGKTTLQFTVVAG